MISGSLPRRYARALIELAKEEGLVDRFGEELEGLSSVLSQVPQILETLSSDWFDFSERLSAVEGIAKKAGIHPLIKNFLILLVKKNRIGLLPDISREYRRFHDEILGIVRATVETPKMPGPELLGKIEKILSEKLRKKVICQGDADPKMIGGLILKLSHTIYDGSVRRELERMKETMMKG